MDAHPLKPLLAPRSVIVLAGPEGQRTPQAQCLLRQIQAQAFHGSLTVVDVQRSGTLAELAASRADLAVLALAPHERPVGVALAARMGCRAALALGEGVSTGEARVLHDLAQSQGLLLLGPNTAGLQNPHLGLNASLSAALAQPGRLALVSQSGAVTSALLDWAAANAVGFSSVVSLGVHSPVDVAELLGFLAADSRTQCILLHIEAVRNARAFMSALRLAASVKPVLVLKSGRHEQDRVAAITHSGALAGRDEVFDAALRRAGALRVGNMHELFSMAKALAALGVSARQLGPRMALVTNGAGPAVLAADGAVARKMRVVAVQEFHEVDGCAALEGATTTASLVGAVDAVQANPEADGVLVLHAPLLDSNPLAAAQALIDHRERWHRPVLACWMGEGPTSQARTLLAEAGIPAFRTPEAAVYAWARVTAHEAHQRLLQQTPEPLSHVEQAPDLAGARLLIDNVLSQRRTVLTEMESKALLAAFHIPVTQTLKARSSHEAMMIASQLGFPVALKIDSEGVWHKSDVDGVRLHVRDAAGVRDAYDSLLAHVAPLLPPGTPVGVTVQPMARSGPAGKARELHVGLVHEPPFGPVVVFGTGGSQVELHDDLALELPPLNRFLAQQLIGRSRAQRLLGVWRGAPAVDHEALEMLLLRVSEMACELPQLRQMDINPVLVDEAGCVAVDARVVLAPEVQAPGPKQPYRHLAIRPYPADLTQAVTLRDGRLAHLRAIRPDDAPLLQALVASLSPESRYNRFAATLTELPPAMLARFTLIDYEREMALVVLHGSGAEERIVGVSRYTMNPDGNSAEFALLVSDAFSGQGLGSRLMETLMAVAREQGLQRLDGLVLCKNTAMLKLVHSLGFTSQPFDEDEDFKFVSHPL